MSSHPIAVPPVPVERKLLLAIVLIALVVSGIAPKDRLTWLLEVIWAIVAMPIIALNWRRFPLTRLLCWLLALHAAMLSPPAYWTQPVGALLAVVLACGVVAEARQDDLV